MLVEHLKRCNLLISLLLRHRIWAFTIANLESCRTLQIFLDEDYWVPVVDKCSLPIIHKDRFSFECQRKVTSLVRTSTEMNRFHFHSWPRTLQKSYGVCKYYQWSICTISHCCNNTIRSISRHVKNKFILCTFLLTNNSTSNSSNNPSQKSKRRFSIQ